MEQSIPRAGWPFFPLKVVRNPGGTAAFNPVDKKDYLLNHDSSELLALCDGWHSRDDIIDQVVRKTGVDEARIKSLSEAVFHDLSLKGMLWWRGERWRLHALPPPQQFYWDITQECNLRCSHCVVSAGRRDPEELTTRECFRLLREARAMGIPSVIFSGGEPLLRPDFFLIADQARRLGFGLALATNGTLIDQDIARKLGHLGMDVQVSLDGSTEEIHDSFRGRTGAFAEAVRGIERLKDAGVPLTIGSVVNRLNLHDFENLLNLSIKLGANQFRLIPFIPFGRGKDSQYLEPTPVELRDVSYLLFRRRQSSPIPIADLEFEFSFRSRSCTSSSPSPGQTFGCAGGSSSFSVIANGEVLPCSFFIGVKAQSVRYHPLDWIWRSSPILNYFRDIRASDIRGGCQRCEWFGECLGGCPAANFAHGKMLQPNVHCWIARDEKEGPI